MKKKFQYVLLTSTFALAAQNAAAQCDVCTGRMQMLERKYSEWRDYQQFRDDLLSIPEAGLNETSLAQIESDPILRRGAFYDFMKAEKQAKWYGRLYAEHESTRLTMDHVREEREHNEQIVDFATSGPVDLLFGTIKGKIFDASESLHLDASLKNLDEQRKKNAAIYAEEDLEAYADDIEQLNQSLDNLKDDLLNDDLDEFTEEQYLYNDLASGRDPEQIEKDYAGGAYGTASPAKAETISNYKDALKSFSKFAETSQSVISTLQGVGIDVPEEIIQTANYLSFAATAATAFTSLPLPLAAISTLTSAKGLFSGGPSADQLILAELSVINQKLDAVLENQQKILETQAIINRKLDLLSNQIAAGNAAILLSIYNSTQTILEALYSTHAEGLRVCELIPSEIQKRMIGQESNGPLTVYRELFSDPNVNTLARDCYRDGLEVLRPSAVPPGKIAHPFFAMDYSSDQQQTVNAFIDEKQDGGATLVDPKDFVTTVYNKAYRYWNSARLRANLDSRTSVGMSLVPSVKISKSPKLYSTKEQRKLWRSASSGISKEDLGHPLAVTQVSAAVRAVSSVHDFLHFTTKTTDDVYLYTNNTGEKCGFIKKTFGNCDDDPETSSLGPTAEAYVVAAERLSKISIAQSALIDGRALLPFATQDIRDGHESSINDLKSLLETNPLLKTNLERSLIYELLNHNDGNWRTFAAVTADGNMQRIESALNRGSQLLFNGEAKVYIHIKCSDAAVEKFCSSDNNGQEKARKDLRFDLTIEREDKAAQTLTRIVLEDFELPTWNEIRNDQYLTLQNTTESFSAFYQISAIATEYRLDANEIYKWEETRDDGKKLSKKDAWNAYLQVTSTPALLSTSFNEKGLQ